ncbi:NAD(P)-dependent oxidoreductase [Actinoplanes sp. NPDC049599]|uniref:NAD(P)-dependent oxidoreductase n=1 Tax=Actinoplanes sp. NPDC049599 TaxID=3363903 RepID=UPI003794AD78
MRIVVFGASGGTGREVVAQGVAAGHRVTAVVRRPGAVPERAGLRVEVVPELGDPAAVDRVVAGQDAVISALGTNARGPARVCTDGIRAILGAMTRAGTRRLVVVSAHGAAETHDGSLYARALWLTLADKMRDKETMEALITAAAVDWTIVRPPALKDRPRTGRYRVGTDLPIRLTSAIGRADLAEFVLGEATAPRYVHRFPRIAA